MSVDLSALWELCDRFEDRARAINDYGPLQRQVWRQAHEQLAAKLGERMPSDA